MNAYFVLFSTQDRMTIDEAMHDMEMFCAVKLRDVMWNHSWLVADDTNDERILHPDLIAKKKNLIYKKSEKLFFFVTDGKSGEQLMDVFTTSTTSHVPHSGRDPPG